MRRMALLSGLVGLGLLASITSANAAGRAGTSGRQLGPVLKRAQQLREGAVLELE